MPQAATPTEVEAMRRAIELSLHGLGRTSPNPVVGSVVLDAEGEVVGEGFHAKAGRPHAEVEALRAAGSAARGGTAVVTLEPCAHTGMTGPCTQALIDAGISRVVVAVTDPNEVAAGGVEVLRAAGIEVITGVLAGEAAAANVAWLTAIRQGRPHVTWKYAATLDGRIAAADGTSRWITGEAARAEVHELRSHSDAVLVGSGTVAADDPHLAVRRHGVPAPREEQPLRIILDSRAAVAPGARVLDDAADTLVVVDAALPAADQAHIIAAGHDVLPVPRTDAGLDLTAVLTALFARGIRSLLLEGGPTTAGSFVAAGAIDRVVAYLAPALLGDGPTVLTGGGISTISDALRLRIDDVAFVGADVRVTAVPLPAEAATAGAPTAETPTSTRTPDPAHRDHAGTTPAALPTDTHGGA